MINFKINLSYLVVSKNIGLLYLVIYPNHQTNPNNFLGRGGKVGRPAPFRPVPFKLA
jgi:hypothetical protein